MKLNIITPVSRPENLRGIKQSFGWKHQIAKWWVVGNLNQIRWIEQKTAYPDIQAIQGASIAIAGHAHRNVALDHIGPVNDWIMSLDDDNILHPDLIPALVHNEYQLDDYDVVIFDQVLKDGTHRLTAHPDNVKPNHIDTAQYMWRGRAAEGVRFKVDLYNADGYFIEEVYQRNKDKTLFVNKPLCYYNYLRS